MKAKSIHALQASLLPCPHCDGPAKLAPMPGSDTWWQVRCQNYHCGGTTWAMSEADQAVAAWNRRAGDGET